MELNGTLQAMKAFAREGVIGDVIADQLPGFICTDWIFDYGGGFEDPDTGEWVSVGEPSYVMRVIGHDILPDVADGRTSVSDTIRISMRDIEANAGSAEAIASLLQGQIDIVIMSIKDLLERKGVKLALPE